MTRLTHVFLAATAAATMTMTALPAHAAPKAAPVSMVIVDMDRVVNESAAGKQASGEIQTKVNQLQTRGQTLQGQLQTEAQAIQKGQQDKTLQGAALEQRVKSFQDRQNAARKELGEQEQKIQESRNYVMEQIATAAEPIVTEVMRERGAAIALDQGATLQHSASLNVTNDIITRLNAKLPRVSTTPPASAAR